MRLFRRPDGAWLQTSLRLGLAAQTGGGTDLERGGALVARARAARRAFSRGDFANSCRSRPIPCASGAHFNTAFGLRLAADYAAAAEDRALAAVLSRSGAPLVRRGRRLPGLGRTGRRRLPLARPDRSRVHAASPACGDVPAVVRSLPAGNRRRAAGDPVRGRRASAIGPTARSPISTGSISAGLGAGERSPPPCLPTIRAASRWRKLRRAILAAGLPHLSVDYMGEHWLASFATLALDEEPEASAREA